METRPVAAALWILTAMVIIGFIDSYVSVIAEEAGVWQFHATRSLMAVPLIALAVWLGIARLRVRNWAGVAGRSLAMTVSMVFYYAALGVLPIAQVIAGFFTAPIFVLLLTALFQRQRIGPWRIGAAAMGFVGVLLILRPDPAALSAWTFVPILAGFFYAVTAMATRSWCEGEDTLTLVAGGFAGLGLAGLLGLVFLAFFPQETAGRSDAFLFTGWVTPTPTFLFWTAVQALGSSRACSSSSAPTSWARRPTSASSNTRSSSSSPSGPSCSSARSSTRWRCSAWRSSSARARSSRFGAAGRRGVRSRSPDRRSRRVGPACGRGQGLRRLCPADVFGLDGSRSSGCAGGPFP